MTSNIKFTDIIGNILYNATYCFNKIYRITSNIKSLTSSGTYCTTTNYCFNKIYRITSNIKFTDIIWNILYNHKLLL